MLLPNDIDDFFELWCYYYVLFDVNETVDTKKKGNLNILNTILNACDFKVFIYIMLLT